jgi:hypothetical protein
MDSSLPIPDPSHTDTKVTARLNEVYADEDSSLDPALRRVQRESIGREEW